MQVLQGLSTYKLTPEQAADNTLDLLTGVYCCLHCMLLSCLHIVTA